MNEIDTSEIAKQMIREDAVLIESGPFDIGGKKYRIIIELKEIVQTPKELKKDECK